MNWLARLKKIETVPQQGATEPTKLAYVGSVAPDIAPLQKNKRGFTGRERSGTSSIGRP